MERKTLLRICFCWVSLICQMALAQNYFTGANDGYGYDGLIFLDDHLYPYETIDRERMSVIYNFELHSDRLPNGKLCYETTLQIGANTTCFLSSARYLVDSLYKENQNMTGALFKACSKGNYVFFHDCYYIDLHSHRLEFTGRLAADDFKYGEILPEIEWEMTDSVATICGYSCRLATGRFRGRNYRAYYTEQIPISAGPWKFHGLPGLILQIQDDQGLFNYKATSVRNSTRGIGKCLYPYINVTRQEYQKLQKQIQANYDAFVNAHISRSGVLSASFKKKGKMKTIEPQELE